MLTCGPSIEIVDLEDHFRLVRADGIKETIIDLSIRHSVLSRFTAFLVVNKQEIVNLGGNRLTYVQPVETPAHDDGLIHPTTPVHSPRPVIHCTVPSIAERPVSPRAPSLLPSGAEGAAESSLAHQDPRDVTSSPEAFNTHLAQFVTALEAFVQLVRSPELGDPSSVKTAWTNLVTICARWLDSLSSLEARNLLPKTRQFLRRLPDTVRIGFLLYGPEEPDGNRAKVSTMKAKFIADAFTLSPEAIVACAQDLKEAMEEALEEMSKHLSASPPADAPPNQEADFWSESI